MVLTDPVFLSLTQALKRIAEKSLTLSSPGYTKARFHGCNAMPTLIPQPTRIQSAGNKPKLIDEYVGRVNSATASVSVAHMRSPGGWLEPGQTPTFDEFTIVLKGTLRVEYKDGALDVTTGQGVIAHAGEWVRYSTPNEDGAEYIAVCLPAFSMESVRRDEDGNR
jgi:mannose-6-phosphate isomerase-like protein (cupin superfamily)